MRSRSVTFPSHPGDKINLIINNKIIIYFYQAVFISSHFIISPNEASLSL